MASSLQYRRIWIALGWLLILTVVYLSLTPQPPTIDLNFGDKIGHLAAYAALMGWWRQIDGNGWRLALLFLLLGLVLEILQSFTDQRQGDLFDLAANAVGIGLGWLSARLAPGWLGRCERRLPA